MSDVIFCKTRHQDVGYGPYNDYFRLAELSGYPVIYVDEIDPDSDHCYIVTPLNGEWKQGWRSPRARIIHYELEWHTDWRAEAPTPPGVAERWTMDAHHAEHLGAKYVPIGSHPDLAGYWDRQGHWIIVEDFGPVFEYDVAMLAYMVGRRQRVADELTRMGVRLAPNAWGYERHKILSQTQVMLHVHQHEHIKGVACLRWAIAAAYAMPLVTESLWPGGIFVDQCHMWEAEPWALAGVVRSVLASPVNTYLGENLHQLLCVEHTFRKNVEMSL